MSEMLDLPDLAVSLAYALEREKAEHQRQVTDQKARIKRLNELLAAALQEGKRQRGQLGSLLGQPECQRCVALRAQVTERDRALQLRNMEVRAQRALQEEVRRLSGENETIGRLYRDAISARDRAREKLRLALGAMEDAREGAL